MRRSPLRPAVLQIAIIVLAAALNFYHIDRASLWNDEGFSFFAALGGPAHTLHFIGDDTQPPFFYLTLGAWLGLGTTVFIIRALSAVAMTLALLPLHAAARRLFDERVALLSMFLFAIAPLAISWAQKARPYPLQVLLVACTFWGFVRVWNARDRVIGAGVAESLRTRAIQPASVDLGWFAYAVGGALAMLAQVPAGFFLLGCNAAMAVAIFHDLRRNRILLINWIIAQLILILIWMLWLPAFLHQIATHLTAAQIASKHAIFLVGFAQVLGTLQGLFGIAALWRPAPVFFGLYLVIAGVGIFHILLHRRMAWPLLVVILVPIAVCLAAFFLVHPIFGYVIYTFIWMLLPYTILIAFGILSIRPLFLRWGVLALGPLGNVWGIKNVYQSDTPPLDRVASIIRTNMAPGDGIVLSEATSGRWGLAYYIGPPYGALTGLGMQDWGSDSLLTSLSQTTGLRRVWVVVVDGEAPVVDLEALQRDRKQGFAERVGSFQITRFD